MLIKPYIWLGWQFLTKSTYEKSFSGIIIVCFLSLFIGSFSLTLISAIMRGFEVAIEQKLQGIHAQATIKSYDEPLDVPAIRGVLLTEFPEIIAISPNASQFVIVRGDEETGTPFVAMLKGIIPAAEEKVTSIKEKLIDFDPKKSLTLLLQENGVLVGKKFAELFDLSVGSSIDLLYTEIGKQKKARVSFDRTTVIIRGIFDTGIEEFDESLIYCSMDFFKTLFPDTGIMQVDLQIKQDAHAETIVERLKNRLKLDTYVWYTQYPALISSLRLERWVMFFILGLITLVASMNIFSLLYMEIHRRRITIALLQVMGASTAFVSNIFFTMGVIITLLSSLAGLLSAIIICHMLHRYPFIRLPDAYYVTELPCLMEWQTATLAVIVVCTIGFIAIMLSLRQIKTISIAQMIRFEG